MTDDEYKLIADVLRRRVNEITKMFEPPGARVPEANVPHAMKVQVMILAQELEYAFYQRDPALKENIFVGAVTDEMKHDVTTPTEPVWGRASGAPRRR